MIKKKQNMLALVHLVILPYTELHTQCSPINTNGKSSSHRTSHMGIYKIHLNHLNMKLFWSDVG